MCCAVIHCVAYKMDCQVALVSIQLTEKIYYVLWSFYNEMNVRFMINRANDIFSGYMLVIDFNTCNYVKLCLKMISCYVENGVKSVKCLELHKCVKAWIHMM
jgi:hypothetical protein